MGFIINYFFCLRAYITENTAKQTNMVTNMQLAPTDVVTRGIRYRVTYMILMDKMFVLYFKALACIDLDF